MSILIFLCILLFVTISLQQTPGQVPIPGKPVYIKQTNSIWIFSFARGTQSGNKLSFLDLNKTFNTLSPPVVDMSSLITGNQCPVMHFAQAVRDNDGVSANIFGAGSEVGDVNYSPTITVCQFNTQTKSWSQINRMNNAPPARRNAAMEFASTGITYMWGGSSEISTGLSSTTAGYPNIWHQDISFYDPTSGWVNSPVVYNGPARANATITQISDTNGQLVVIGGSLINNSSAVDMVTNFPLANMSDIVVLDPRTSIWTNVTASGIAPTPRKHHTTTLHPDGHTLIVIGGETFNASGAYVLNDVWTLDTRNMNAYVWKNIDVGGDAGFFRSNHTSILIDDQIWVLAGTNTSAKAVDIQLLNVTSWTWSFNAVSTVSTAAPYSSIGGVKGLIGLVVGVVGGVLLLACCFLVWWCRRRRVDPTKSTAKQDKSAVYTDHDGHVQEAMIQHQYHSSTNPPDNTTTDASKITPRPSLSTTTSGGVVGFGDWNNNNNNQMHMNNYNNTTIPNSPAHNNYYIPQYTNAPAMPLDHYNTYNESDMYAEHPPPFSSTTVHRQSLGNYWETPSQQHPVYQPEVTSLDHSYMLTPMQETRPVSRIQPSQVLQKPNEADATTSLPATGSTTVYSASTNEDHRSISP